MPVTAGPLCIEGSNDPKLAANQPLTKFLVSNVPTYAAIIGPNGGFETVSGTLRLTAGQVNLVNSTVGIDAIRPSSFTLKYQAIIR